MYLAQYNTFCSEKKICVCVWGGGSNFNELPYFWKIHDYTDFS